MPEDDKDDDKDEKKDEDKDEDDALRTSMSVVYSGRFIRKP